MQDKNNKYTVVIFDPGGYGKSRTFNVTLKPIWCLGIVFLLLITMTCISSYFAYKYSHERNTIIVSGDNKSTDITEQLNSYAERLESINEKIASLDELEYKVRDLVSAHNGENHLKPLAIGGKETEILKDYFSVSDRREQEFFENLNETLIIMSAEIEKRETSLSQLVNFLEEQRLAMLSTPSIWPVRGWVSSPFGFRNSPFSGRRVFHEGLDIAAKHGTNVLAAANGMVVYAGERAGYGNLVTIDHGYGYMTRYAHNSSILVKVGDKVKKGDPVARVGSTGRSTGPHLHYEVMVNGVPVNPVKFIVEDSSN